MRRILLAFERFLLILTAIPFLGLLKLCKRNSEIVVIVGALYYKKLGRELIIRELGYVIQLIKQRKRFSLGGLKGSYEGKTIFWAPSEYYNKQGYRDYSRVILNVAESLESQGNRIFPNSKEVKYLENKYFMYSEFIKHGVNHPKTYLFNSLDDIEWSSVTYPILWKGAHSNSGRDVKKFESEEALRSFLSTRPSFDNIILQELVNMRMDMRVTVVCGEVYSAYWRINEAEEWRITSTSNGSRVQFLDHLDDFIENDVLKVFNTLSLDTGCVDICWENDLFRDTSPLFLEISPLFSINPKVNLNGKGYGYGEYKKKAFIKDGYGRKQQEELLNIVGIYTSNRLNEKSNG